MLVSLASIFFYTVTNSGVFLAAGVKRLKDTSVIRVCYMLCFCYLVRLTMAAIICVSWAYLDGEVNELMG
jgi:hypothetical protein